MRSEEVAGSRLTDDKIRQNFEDMARKNEEDSRVRREKGVRMREEKKQQDLEDLKPKARSALAARWEESVKAKNAGGKEEHRATVVTRAKTTDEEVSGNFCVVDKFTVQGKTSCMLGGYGSRKKVKMYR